MSAVAEQKGFYGWWISVAAFFTFGLAVGIPYYGMGFYYDYYQKAFGWTRPEMTLGFPLAVVLTLWVGPVIMHRYSPRILMMIGAGLTALAFIGFSTMTGNLMFYYGMWTLYTVGYILSGPIAHQIIISQWFKRHRGKAMAATYLGVGVFGGLVVKYFAAPITQATNFQNALFWTGIAVLLVIPIAFIVLKDKPSDIGQTPDGLPVPASEVPPPSRTIRDLLHQPAFWLLMVGSLCSIGAIGSINFHMKLVFKDQGFTDQKTLDTIFGNANLCILFSSIGGRIAMGYLADRFSKKYVMVTTYFLVAATIPLLFLVRPETPEYVYLFAILFGFGMGADYMLIPLMAAEQFGVNTLARAMAIILPTDTIGQTWFPYIVSKLRESAGSYATPLQIVFVLAALGATAIFLLPSHGKKDEALLVQESGSAKAGR
jgi:MFS family permease